MIKEGDLILLYKDPQRNYLLKVTQSRFHTDKGFIEIKDAIGRDFGASITTNLNESFVLLKPSLYELTMKVNRQTQIIYPKDIGIILTKSTIYPGGRIIEVGTGSGALTTAMAHFIRPNGKIYSYERRADLLENARKNINKNLLSEWVEFIYKEVTDRFDQEDIDFVMLDTGSPWLLIDAAYQALKPGHKLAAICPCFEQVTQTVFGL
ncbi:MAG: methyltransferase domain-containing protein, partial [Candidatus Omnitrophota bacterium]